MKYMLKTEVNENGNLVFSKQRNGKSFIYLAKDETGATATVDKDWILLNQKNIVNLGVSGDNLIATKTDKKSNFDLVEETVNIVSAYYSTVSQYDLIPTFNYKGETEGITEIDVGGRNIDHYFGYSVNGFDLTAIDKEYKKLAQYWDEDTELVAYMNDFRNDSDFYCLTADKVKNMTKLLSTTVRNIELHSKKLKELYNALRPYYAKWVNLCHIYGHNTLVELLEKEFSIYELI